MHHIDIASFWPGYTVIAQALSANHHTLFTFEPRADFLPRCRRCLQPTPLIHDQRIRRVRERDLFDRQVWLQLPVRRVD
ncbi:transposase family protein, partial [Aeromonas sp. Prich7-2]|nr:transposase family protein [Aeromonas sp. Prich7-2]